MCGEGRDPAPPLRAARRTEYGSGITGNRNISGAGDDDQDKVNGITAITGSRYHKVSGIGGGNGNSNGNGKVSSWGLGLTLDP
eukprot:g6306.t1